ncbi:MAG: hypothetical protein LWW95_08265 [Candidatus Desulfofervidus auxilii]|nr:hypothetical protein [Candidatus Desulfofervidus auxilii]
MFKSSEHLLCTGMFQTSSYVYFYTRFPSEGFLRKRLFHVLVPFPLGSEIKEREKYLRIRHYSFVFKAHFKADRKVLSLCPFLVAVLGVGKKRWMLREND